MPATLTIDPKAMRAFQQWAATLPGAFLECRQYGHAWTGLTVATGRRNYEVTLRCMRCTSTASEVLSKRNGVREGRRKIAYVEGYLAHGLGPNTSEKRSFMRLEAAARLAG